MKQCRLFLLVFALGAGAWAQTPVARTAATEAAPEQRRAELRLMLKAPRGQDAAQSKQGLEKMALNRHLSTQELADLRRQLRQQYRDARPDRP